MHVIRRTRSGAALVLALAMLSVAGTAAACTTMWCKKVWCIVVDPYGIEHVGYYCTACWCMQPD